MAHDGYTFQAAPPFALKPVPPPPPRPLDPAHVAYAAPAVFYFNPVRGSLLAVGPRDGLVTVATLAGTLVALTDPAGAAGKVQYKYALPFIKPQAAAPAGALGAKRRHASTPPPTRWATCMCRMRSPRRSPNTARTAFLWAWSRATRPASPRHC